MDIVEIKEFFEKLCAANININHSEKSKRCFFWDKDELVTFMSKGRVEYPLVFIHPMTGHTRGGKGSLKEEWMIGFSIIAKVDTRVKEHTSKYRIWHETHSIGQQLNYKVWNDYKENKCAIYWPINRVDWEFITFPWLENCYGTSFKVPMKVAAKTKHDPNNWK